MKLDNKGFLYAEVLILIVIMSVIFSAGAIAGRNFLLNAAADFEATKLIASLRYIQELNRNSYVVREGEFKKIEPKNSTTFSLNIDSTTYQIKSSLTKFPTLNYKAVKNIMYQETPTLYNGISFFIDGNPKKIGSVQVKAIFGNKQIIKYGIIDRAGRIRLDRKLQ